MRLLGSGKQLPSSRKKKSIAKSVVPDCETLRLMLSSRNLSTQGNKNELLNRWMNFVEEGSASEDCRADPSKVENKKRKLRRSGRNTSAIDKYAGHVSNFNIPPDEMLVPDNIQLGSWVYTVFDSDPGVAFRGIVVSLVKGDSTRMQVRFLSEESDSGVDDIYVPKILLFKTRQAALDEQQESSESGDDAE